MCKNLFKGLLGSTGEVKPTAQPVSTTTASPTSGATVLTDTPAASGTEASGRVKLGTGPKTRASVAGLSI